MTNIFSFDGLLLVLRWLHFFFGIIWIGMLYYFNFVHGAFMGEIDAPNKTVVASKLLPRALWWFRWGAMWTFVTGWIYLMGRGHMMGIDAFATGWGVFILTGALLGSLMWFNVWFVIWPKQKVVIASAEGVAQGKPANPSAADAGARALCASRTNALFSIPMLFCMGAASHFPLVVGADSIWPLVGTLALLIGAIELNAIKGKVGPLATVRNVIHFGFLLAIVLYVVIAGLI